MKKTMKAAAVLCALFACLVLVGCGGSKTPVTDYYNMPEVKAFLDSGDSLNGIVDALGNNDLAATVKACREARDACDGVIALQNVPKGAEDVHELLKQAAIDERSAVDAFENSGVALAGGNDDLALQHIQDANDMIEKASDGVDRVNSLCRSKMQAEYRSKG